MYVEGDKLIMSNQWSEIEQVPLIAHIVSYRQSITNKETKEAKEITLKEAIMIQETYSVVQQRTHIAIFERMCYLDNLLAGVFENMHYAKKDQYLYGVLPRENQDVTPNFINTRHSYNGAREQYWKNK